VTDHMESSCAECYGLQRVPADTFVSIHYALSLIFNRIYDLISWLCSFPVFTRI